MIENLILIFIKIYCEIFFKNYKNKYDLIIIFEYFTKRLKKFKLIYLIKLEKIILI